MCKEQLKSYIPLYLAIINITSMFTIYLILYIIEI